MKILFFIERIEEGGKEKRLLELIKWLKADPDFSITLILMDKDIYYSGYLDDKIDLKFLVRKNKYDITIFLKLFLICIKLKPDVIHTWGPLPSLFSLFASVFLGIPLLDSQITSAPLRIKRFSSLWLVKNLSFLFASKIISNTYAGLYSFKAPKSKSICIPNGFDFDRLKGLKSKSEVKAQLNIKSEYIIGMIASFSDSKDYSTYFSAAERILSKREDVTFLAIGTGKNYNYYKNKIKDSNLTDKVLLLGKQEKVEDIINICDIGVLSTYSEGLSNSLIEFMAAGKPVIASKCAGNEELINDGIDGVLIPVSDVEMLANNIGNLLDNPLKRTELANNGRNKIEQNFNKELMLNSFKQLYLKYNETN